MLFLDLWLIGFAVVLLVLDKEADGLGGTRAVWSPSMILAGFFFWWLIIIGFVVETVRDRRGRE